MLRKIYRSAVKIENRDRNKWISVHHECSTHLVNQLISCSERELYREQRERNILVRLESMLREKSLLRLQFLEAIQPTIFAEVFSFHWLELSPCPSRELTSQHAHVKSFNRSTHIRHDMFEAFVDSIIPLNLSICLFGVLNVLSPANGPEKLKNQQISVSHALITLPRRSSHALAPTIRWPQPRSQWNIIKVY